MSGCTPATAAAPSGAGQKKATIAIDPVTRIEGHLKAEVVVENGVVVDAQLTGGMFRGFEQILKGRDPRDASQIVQRICGVCPTAHATASVMALDQAFNVKVPTNGRVTRNLIFGANYLQSHLLHFYHLAAQDFVQGPDSAPFVPRFKKSDLRLPAAVNKVAVDQYLEALEMRRICHEMVALFGGRMPHVQGMVVGGVTEVPSKQKIVEYAARFKKVRAFVETKYLPVVYTVGAAYKDDMFSFGQGYKNAICCGAFPLTDSGVSLAFKRGVYINGKDMPMDPRKIKEYVKYSWFDDSTTGLPITNGKTVPAPDKKGAYSFIKSPRYDGAPVEVGPLARMWVTNPDISPVGREALKQHFGLNVKKFRDMGEDVAFSLMGRHVARAEETYYMLAFIERWLGEVRPGAQSYVKAEIPDSGEGLGLTEAPRGALLHYVNVKGGVIENYQIVSATLWNSNPKDDMGQHGPMEQALIGTPVPDIDNPVNVARLIRAFDP